MSDVRSSANGLRPGNGQGLGHRVAARMPTGADVRLALPVTVYLIGVLTPIYFNLGPLALGTLRAALMIYFIPFAWMVFSGRCGRLNMADIFLPIHAFWTFLSIVLLNPERAIQFVGSTTLEFFGGYLIARACIRSREDFLRLTKVLAWVIILTLLPLALFETLTARPIFINFLASLPGIFTVENVYMPERMGFDRAQTVFSHPIHHGLFCSIAFSLVFVGLKDEVSDAKRYFLAGMIFFATFWSLSSGAILALAMQFGMIIYFTITQRVKNRWLILLGLAVSAYIVIDLISTRSAMQVFMSYATFSPYNAYWRAEIFKWGMHNVWANPIFGIGMANWVRPWWMISPSVDNYWLLMAMRHGIPAFVFLAIGILGSLYKVGRRDFSGDPQLCRLRRAWMFNMIGLIFTLCTVHIWTAAMSFYYFMVGAGMWMIYAQPKTPADPEAEDTPAPNRPASLPYARFHGPDRAAQSSRYSRTKGPR